MGTVHSQVDELLAHMTPAEKAGQLTQYFYFRLPEGAETNPALGLDVDGQPRMVESALGEGAAGSLLFVTDPAETNRLQRLGVEGNRLGIPVLFGFDVIHGLRTILPVLWNVYFPPFEAAVAAGAGNVMTAYMALNGVPATGNRWLFTEVLRERWGSTASW